MSRYWRKPRAVPDDEDQKYREFSGLTNTRAEKDFGFSALAVANNVLGTDGKKIVTRPGYSLFRSGTPTSAYVQGDNLYVVDNGDLLHVMSATEVRTLTSGLTGKNYSWDVVNNAAYFVNGVEAGIVRNDLVLPLRIYAPTITSVSPADVGVVPPTAFNMGQQYTSAVWRFCATYETADGRESAPSDVVEVVASPTTSVFTASIKTGYARTNVYVTEPDGTVFRLAATTTQEITSVVPQRATRELTIAVASPLPDGVDQIAYWNGRMYVVQYFPAENTSIVWFSRAFAFHLYDMGKDFFVVPGRVAMLLWNNEGLLVGSTEAIFQYKDTGTLETLVSYGVVPGSAGVVDPEGMAYFWTTRGFCKAMPFENLTEKQVGMAPGLWANTSMVYMDGMQQIVTITQGGGTPFNVRS